MTLQVGHHYLTKSGNIVRCTFNFENGTYLGHYENTIEGHEALKGTNQKWQENGDWNAYPGGIHDIIKAV